MKGGGARAARSGGHIHEHQIGGGAVPIGGMRKIQDRFLASTSRPGPPGTTGSVVKMRFSASISTATPVNRSGAVQRTDPHEVRRIGKGEHLLDVPGLLPVSCQVNLHLFEHDAIFHQPATHRHRFFAQVMGAPPRC